MISSECTLTTTQPIALAELSTMLAFSSMVKLFSFFPFLGMLSTLVSIVSGTESLISLERTRPSVHSSKIWKVSNGKGNLSPTCGSPANTALMCLPPADELPDTAESALMPEEPDGGGWSFFAFNFACSSTKSSNSTCPEASTLTCFKVSLISSYEPLPSLETASITSFLSTQPLSSKSILRKSSIILKRSCCSNTGNFF
ncbi:hypothetical protein OGATHE_000228 [Ogataea polymorpha]|uniref:Uncharacterized protein n=1 Tax=Ogataea polymorpha TaxID=460523 RepID=A0A9P8TGF9_9ASCO|nr:hypothetical protein OGATHE_000228 [Ogataea polymorpha]